MKRSFFVRSHSLVLSIMAETRERKNKVGFLVCLVFLLR